MPIIFADIKKLFLQADLRVSLDYIAWLTNNKRGLSAGYLSDSQQELLRFAESMTEEERKRLSCLAEKLNRL